MKAKQRQCKSRWENDPKRRCTKDRGHHKTALNTMHGDGTVSWSSPGEGRGHSATRVILDEIHKMGPPTSVVFTPPGGKPIDLTNHVRGIDFTPRYKIHPGLQTYKIHPGLQTYKIPPGIQARIDNLHTHFVAPGTKIPPMEPLPPEPTQRDRAEAELRGWWFDQAEAEIDGTVAKAIEYSSTDLVDIGRTLGYISGRTVSDEEAAELGVFFYLQGKLSRWAGAIKTGKRPSDDTLYDIGVYVRMAQRIRKSGSWPGVDVE